MGRKLDNSAFYTSLAGFIFGILPIVLLFVLPELVSPNLDLFGILVFIGIFLLFLGLVLGLVALFRKPEKKWKGIISIILALIFIIVFVSFVVLLKSIFSNGFGLGFG